MAFSLILLILSITLPYALWSLTLTKKLLANDKIKAYCSTNTLPKHYIKRYKQQKWTFQKPTTAIRFNLLEGCPSVAPFVFAALFLPSFNVFSGYICVLLNLEAVPKVRIFDNIRDTAPLILNLRSYCPWKIQSSHLNLFDRHVTDIANPCKF